MHEYIPDRVETYVTHITGHRQKYHFELYLKLIINLLQNISYLLFLQRLPGLQLRTLWIQTLNDKVRRSLFLLRSWYEQGPSGREWENESCEGAPRTTKAKLVFLLPANHWRAEITKGDPEVLPTLELCAQVQRPMPRCARASSAPKGSPDWPSAGPTSAGWRYASLCLIAKSSSPAHIPNDAQILRDRVISKGLMSRRAFQKITRFYFEKRDREKQLAKINSCTVDYVHGFHVLMSMYAVKNRSWMDCSNKKVLLDESATQV